MPTPAQPDRHLPASFRKWDVTRRRKAIMDLLSQQTGNGKQLSKASVESLGADPDAVDLADVLVESAIGYFSMPMGICRGLLMDGAVYDVPLVTEEPSVIAAVTYASGMIARAGGFETWTGEPITTGQVFLENGTARSVSQIEAIGDEIRTALAPVLSSMERRGGGYRGFDVLLLPDTRLVRVQIHVNVCDAMGANIVNTAAEAARPILEKATGLQTLMAILTNAADRRITGARFRLPAAMLARGGMTGAQVGQRVVLASRLAQEDSSRAVTHNKGVMNGVTALLLATANDTRAAEAGVHSYACRDGSYRGIATYELSGDALVGTIQLPLAVGTVGGAAGIHPTSRMALQLLGNPGATELARIAASIGLAQNLAAVSALVTEGIQRGHMSLHARRLAWQAGARGAERETVAGLIAQGGVFNLAAAAAALDLVREGSGDDNIAGAGLNGVGQLGSGKPQRDPPQ